MSTSAFPAVHGSNVFIVYRMQMVTFFRTILVIGFAGSIGWSCSNELEMQSSDCDELPVINGILELNRDTQCIRITRTFKGTGSGLNSAKNEDSLYFPEVRAWLEKWNGNQLVCKAELVKTNATPRLSGIFPIAPNWNYILVRSPENEPLFTGNQSYHLSVEIPGLPLVYAQTFAYPAAKLIKPALTYKINLFLDPLLFEWSTGAPYYELYLKLLYTDVYRDTTIARSISWREYHNYQPGQPEKENVFGQDIMKRIAGQVSSDPAVKYRYITNLQVIVVGIPADLYEYREMTQTLPTDQIGYPVTNIVNGIGLFSSQTQTVFDLIIDEKSKDSIMHGQYTKQLNFRYY